ncbi:MAG: multicopper oxidase domain-containing protein [Leptolyngbya sp. SIO4C5]|nr:multicopper oxidase domain-containing protein [Leptolyngbya sp. SIO4C5]
MKLSRRDALKLGLATGGAWLGTAQSAEAATKCPPQRHHGSPLDSPIPETDFHSPWIEPFQRRFQTPPELRPVRSDERGDRPTDYYEITLRKAQVNILADRPTEVWSYNGVVPGPTIRQRGGIEPEDQGRQSVVRFINQIGQDDEGQDFKTVTHLHGMASLPQYDGYAEDLIPPDHFKDYIYPNDRAATIWYHDHAVEQTSRNVYKGLAGMYIVEDEYERRLNLPAGDYDVPLILQDVRLDENGKLLFNDRARRSLYGDITLVNGVPWPYMPVERRKYRFRVLKGDRRVGVKGTGAPSSPASVAITESVSPRV